MPEFALSVMSPLTEAHLREAMDAMPVPVAAFDPFGRVLCWNREAQRITGWTFHDLQGGALECLIPNALERALLIEEWGRKGEAFEAWEWTITGRDGSPRILRWTCQTHRHPVPGWATWMVGAPAEAERASHWRPPFVRSAG
ncbi:MAG TPA: PAS domain-containing protein [Holophagaceae bacterium]|nr:PAS domain-containing protein [Holophagaceae bacterium]